MLVVPEDAKQTLWTKDFVLIAAVNYLIFSSWQTFPFVLPVYLQSLGANDAALGWVTAITTVSALLVRPFCGIILDRFGRKGIFLAGIAFMGLAAASFAFIPVVGIILALRFVHGLAWGITSTSSSTVASDIIPPKRFGEGMGLFALSASLAFAIAPGVALELFHANGMVPVVMVAVATLALAFAFASTLKYRTLKKPASLHLASMFNRSSVLPALIMLFMGATYGSLVTFLAIHASSQGVENVGFFFTAYAIAVALSRPFLGRIVDRKGYAPILLPGIVLVIVGLVVLSQAHSLGMFVLTAFLYGFGFAGCNSTLQTMAVADAEPEHRGAANATFLIGFDGGIGIGSVVSGWIAASLGYAGMYLCFAALPLVSAALFLVFARNRKPPNLAQEAKAARQPR